MFKNKLEKFRSFTVMMSSFKHFIVRNALPVYNATHISHDKRHAAANITTNGPMIREPPDLALRGKHGTNNYQ